MKFNFRLGKLACNELDNNTPITVFSRKTAICNIKHRMP